MIIKKKKTEQRHSSHTEGGELAHRYHSGKLLKNKNKTELITAHQGK